MREEFDRILALSGNTLIVFEDLATADAFGLHQFERGARGILCRVEDTRERTGLVVQWRDPIKAAELPRHQAEARWLLKEVLAGRVPRPERGKVVDISPEVEAARQAAQE